MKYRPRWSLLGIGAIIVVVLFTYPQWHTFLQRRTGGGLYPNASDAQREVLGKMNKIDPSSVPNAAPTAYVSMLTVVPAPTKEEPTPDLPDAQIILSGSFADLDALRTASGDISLYRSADGSLLLRFDNFSVANAPQLTVYLCGNAQPQLSTDLDIPGASRFPVGPLKGTKGNQQYSLPRELTVSRYKSVVIYSDGLGLIYAFAELK
jgi:hypothetical protein